MEGLPRQSRAWVFTGSAASSPLHGGMTPFWATCPLCCFPGCPAELWPTRAERARKALVQNGWHRGPGRGRAHPQRQGFPLEG